MKIVIATCVYEAARPYLRAFMDGARAASQGHEAALVAVLDGLADPESSLAPLAGIMPVRLVPSEAGGSDEASRLSAVRAAMLKAADASDADAVVFCDADDVLTPPALALHEAALSRADISVGDLQPIDDRGQRFAAPMLGAALPDVISPATLAETNVCGFSNTAVRRGTLRSVTQQPMPPVIAADWWTFAALLDAGYSACRADGVVAFYRQHAGNILGAGGASDIAGARRRLRIVADHHRARGELERANVAERLAADPDRLADFIRRMPSPASGPWHADAAAWCRLAMNDEVLPQRTGQVP
ncbi:hypothetical protein GCM10007276_10870 [Agaricicola taiwanensis]|uniref:Glycosyltransferase 2-like domain-containing protein n=1 Tax=Agaricicola taiwanensis TaxID=591372 RepID=A0A8J2VPY9_9RHOB|nr:hypothetical protein [Agaricicola taiwanensis]GGE35183.1 hypothetical protein GCM10007276_10870 [Agaricicola taiwanensis]